MALTLNIFRARWDAHQRTLLADIPGIVPVAKGNGYGFTLELLAARAAELGVDAIAVGIAQEVARVRAGGWTGDVVVLNPWRPFDALATELLDDDAVVTTVSRVEDLRAIAAGHPGARVIVELSTSMLRHGLAVAELAAAVDALAGLRPEGWAIHLPATGSLDEARRLADAAVDALPAPVWVSHLSVTDYRTLAGELEVPTRMRVGTRLWLGDRSAYETTATVLDVHPVAKGQRIGYHQAPMPKAGFVVIVSGGTAEGVAMAAPVPQRSVRKRLVTATEGMQAALGRSLSPFAVGGRKRAFAEPPHMHSSMVFVPGSTPTVKVGDEVPVTTRMTTVTADEIRWS
ncbi:MAG: alanine racemase [Tessaracoccus sp.]|uniref:alanine racemase n=1 Tax=Tessaracoccus sp. TaxID=1971211 RepID=UPI001EC3191E|nr:alanine racemase [Tessaracoccus sp.]MBK7822300.1 alanine racemase [Tessaracoccus sp.]